MCGIAGIVSAEPLEDLEPRVRRMQAAMRHRGPDDQGIFLDDYRQVGLAHTRLSIIDLGPSGHQPMATPDSRWTIVFNGEIYNYRELRADLEARGVVFRSNSDTEVILRLYERYGRACVRHLRGMFALAIWDSSEKLCFLARDPLGIKPLYFSLQKSRGMNRLVFASELRALVSSGLVSSAVQPEALMGYLYSGSVPEPQTMIEGVECLQAGSSLSIGQATSHHEHYWEFPGLGGVETQSGESANKPAAVSAREALLDSIRAHYVSDVPVGLFLSGGIDSTAVAALSSVIGQSGIASFSIAFEDDRFDESAIARKTARHFGTRHHEWRISDSEAGNLLGKFFSALDQPSVDGFNTWCVSKLAHESGCKVVLSGLGGDELFGGYPSFSAVPKMARAGLIPRIFRVPVGEVLQAVGKSSKVRRMGEYLQGGGSLEDAWGSARGVFTRSEARKLAHWLCGREDHFDAFNEAGVTASVTSIETPRETVSRLELTRYMRNQLLRDSDVMSMAWGLELRVPLVDSRLLSSMWRLPPAVRLEAGKRLLTDAIPEIPEWVVGLPKKGFQFPFAVWMDSAWRDRFRMMSAESPIPLTQWYQRWILVAFQHWRDHFESFLPASAVE